MIYLLRQLPTRYADYKFDSVITTPYLSIRHQYQHYLPPGARDFSLLRRVQTALWSTGATFCGIKGRRRQGCRSSTSSIEVKNEWRCIRTVPHMPPERTQGKIFYFYHIVRIINIFVDREFIFQFKIQRWRFNYIAVSTAPPHPIRQLCPHWG